MQLRRYTTGDPIASGYDGIVVLHATVADNAVDIQHDGSDNAVASILAQSDVTDPQGNGASICGDIGGALWITFTHSQDGTTLAGDIRVRQRANDTMNLEGYAGGAADTSAAIAYLAGRNTAVSAPTATAGNTGFGDATCSTP